MDTRSKILPLISTEATDRKANSNWQLAIGQKHGTTFFTVDFALMAGDHKSGKLGDAVS